MTGANMKNVQRTMLIVGLLMTYFMITPAHAIIQLLGDMTYEYQTHAGKVIHGQLQIHNPDSKTATVQLLKQDADTKRKNQPHPRSNLQWIQLSQEQLTIEPYTTASVAYQIHTPYGATPGTHWSKILIDPVSQNGHDRPDNGDGTYTVGVMQKIRYAVNMFTHIGQGNVQLEFQNPKIAHNGRERIFSFDVMNNGTAHSQPKVSMEVFSNDGRRIASLKGNQRGLLPNYNKVFEIPLTNIPSNRYKALLVAIDQKTGKTFGTDINLTINP